MIDVDTGDAPESTASRVELVRASNNVPQTALGRAIRKAERVAEHLEKTDEGQRIEKEERGQELVAAILAVAKAGEDDTESLQAWIEAKIEDGGSNLDKERKYEYQPLVKAFIHPESWKRSRSTVTRYAIAIAGLEMEQVSPAKAVEWMRTADPALGSGIEKAVQRYKQDGLIQAREKAEQKAQKDRDLALIDKALQMKPPRPEALIGHKFGFAVIEIEPDSGELRPLLVWTTKKEKEVRDMARTIRRLWPFLEDE